MYPNIAIILALFKIFNTILTIYNCVTLYDENYTVNYKLHEKVSALKT